MFIQSDIVKNTGDTELKDIAVTDSPAGFAPIGTLPGLAPNEEKTFDYAYTVKEEDIRITQSRLSRCGGCLSIILSDLSKFVRSCVRLQFTASKMNDE